MPAPARLYQRPKSAMQSGRRGEGDWVLEHERIEPQRHDPLTGWIGSSSTNAQIQLRFPTREAALTYAAAHDLRVDIVTLGPRTLKIRTYAENFR